MIWVKFAGAREAEHNRRMKTGDFDRKAHWDRVYSQKKAHETSWYQQIPKLSVSMIEKTGLGAHVSVIDIGGGASGLVDQLLLAGYSDLTVLDISSAALEQARKRLGERAAQVQWLATDVREFLPRKSYGIWHDRAAFHFLTDPRDRKKYIRVLTRALKPEGQAVIAAFARDGPEKCSGLEVVRYDAATLSAELGPDFVLEQEEKETHTTPMGREQRFAFFRFRRNE